MLGDGRRFGGGSALALGVRLAFALGLLLLAVHLVALLKADSTQSFLKQFPRNYKWGVILLSIDFA